MTICASCERTPQVGRARGRAGGSSCPVARLDHPQPVTDRDARRDDEEPLREAGVAGVYTLLIVCQAISIAITTVLPVPVAIFNADPRQPVVVEGVLALESPGSRAAVRPAPRRGRSPSRRLALAEHHPVLAVGSAQCCSSLREIGRDARVAPLRHSSTW
jgi:hypothetical protein